jgi:hypothetical protein
MSNVLCPMSKVLKSRDRKGAEFPEIEHSGIRETNGIRSLTVAARWNLALTLDTGHWTLDTFIAPPRRT